jgi:hypothetical protein
MSSGGGGKSTTTYTTNMPKEGMEQYVGLLGRGSTASQQPYQPYDQQRIAGFTDMQSEAQRRAAGQQLPGQTGEASNIAANLAYGPSGIGQQGYGMMDFAARTGSTAGQQTAGGNYAANQMLRQGDPTAQGQYGMSGIASGMDASNAQRWIDPGISQQYMDPYMQQVVDIQKRESNRDFGQQSQMQRAKTGMTGGVGGIGGYRDQILQAEANRNQMQNLGDIQQKGLQESWRQGQATFGADEQRQLAAAQQRAQAGQALSEQSRLGQQLGLEGLKGYMQDTQFGRQMGLDTSKFMGSLGSQMADQGRQQQALSLDSAKTLGLLGQQQYEQERGLTDQMDKYGAQQQALQQKYLDQQYQDFLTQKDYEWDQINRMSQLLHGQNLGSVQTQQGPGQSMGSTVAGGGLTLAALYQMLGKGGA